MLPLLLCFNPALILAFVSKCHAYHVLTFVNVNDCALVLCFSIASKLPAHTYTTIFPSPANWPDKNAHIRTSTVINQNI